MFKIKETMTKANAFTQQMAELDKISEIALPSPYYMDTRMKSGRARVFFTNKDLPEGASVENQMFSIASHKLALD